MDSEHTANDLAQGRITRLLEEAAGGSETAFEAVVAEVYPELERVALGKLRARGGHPGLTLEPGELVNETLLKMLGGSREFKSRRHFYSFATKVMMSVLLDYGRRRSAQKRGGDQLRVTLTGIADRNNALPVAELHELLEQLKQLDPRKAEVVQLRFFWGLEVAEIAETLGVSPKTVDRDWRFSRSWLASALGPKKTEPRPDP